MTRPLIRPPAVAGTFYPADEHRLAAQIDHDLARVAPCDDPWPPSALVAPHAGYVYSGPVAASAYARLVPWRDAYHRVVVLGPAHRVAVRGGALSSADQWRTPLGLVPLDRPFIDHLAHAPALAIDDHAHAREHSIEVHIPFLQRVLAPGWRLVPVVVGVAPVVELADAFDEVWDDPGTLFVISSDLSHYHDVATARRLDRDTAHVITSGAWEDLGPAQACGAAPLRVALELGRRHHEHFELLDLRNSADTAGPAESVVGYGSFVVR